MVKPIMPRRELADHIPPATPLADFERKPKPQKKTILKPLYNEELVPVALGLNQYFRRKKIPVKASAGLRSINFQKILCDDGTCGGCMTKGATRKYLSTFDVDLDTLLEKPPKATIETIPTPNEPTIRTGEVLYGNSTTVKTPNEDISAKYALVELSYLQPSHLPERSFKENPNYIEKCQQRDYQYDKSEQSKVLQYAQRFDPEFLISNDKTPVNGSPIVLPNGMVLGGNGRSMILRIISDDKFSRYISYLKKSASLFGFEKSDIDSFKKPVLVRVIDVSVSKCATYSNILNKSFTQALDLDTKALSYMRQLGERELEAIAELFENNDINTLSEAFDNIRTVRGLQGILQRAGIITQQEYNSWITADGKFTIEAKLVFERILLGAIFEDTKLIDVAKKFTNHIIKTIVLLIKNKSLGDYSIIPYIQSAFVLIKKADANDLKKKYFLNQTNAFDKDVYSDEDIIIWNALDSLLKTWKQFLADYTRLATNNQTEDLWAEKLTQTEILHKVAKNLGLLEYTSLADQFIPKKERTLNDLVRLTPQEALRLPKPLAEFLGRLPRKFNMLLWGPPGSGKSTFSMQLATALSFAGNVRYITSEESTEGNGFIDRIKRVRAYRPIIATESRNYKDIVNILKSTTNNFVIIDSVNNLDIPTKNIVELFKLFPQISFIFIAHAQKDQRAFRGATELAHEVDIVVKAIEGSATTTKNRFSSLNSYTILKQKNG